MSGGRAKRGPLSPALNERAGIVANIARGDFASTRVLSRLRATTLIRCVLFTISAPTRSP